MQRDVSPMPVSVKKEERDAAATGTVFFESRKQRFLFVKQKEKTGNY
jgi:hypothetical protein